jgi:hypothetical protein
MRLMRRTEKYTSVNNDRNEEILKELKTERIDYWTKI